MRPKAVLITHGCLDTIHAKTAHGLLRHSDRFEIIGLVDEAHSGHTTQKILGESFLDVPIFSSLENLHENLGEKIDFCITGIATHGGILPDQIRQELLAAIGLNISVINSLHQFLSEDSDFIARAKKQNVQIKDIRRPKLKSELRFWSGEITSIDTPIIAVLGTDCALGKRTTTQWLVRAAQTAGCNAHMIYTGQTGWLQGAKHGFIFDSTLNDFISGELEGAILQCWREESPDLMVIEGQSSLRNPSGPCGAEFLISGRAKGVVLQHAPARTFYDGFEERGLKIPPIEEEIDLISRYGSQVIAISMNTEGVSADQLDLEKQKLYNRTGLPIFAVREEGCHELFKVVADWMK